MKHLGLIAFVCCRLAAATDPVHNAWIMSPAGGSPSMPEVHSVESGERTVTVRSAGLSIKYLGPLQPAPMPSAKPRQFVFEIPVHPEPELGYHARVPVDVIGTFVNGLPIYNHFEALSWNGANLWHYDAVAYNDDGRLTAAGHPRMDLTHPAAGGLLEQLVRSGSKHSPLIGFALDGYPVYGPWAYANGKLRRMRSSYQLRSIAKRHDWPDGTRLMPEQYGPDVSATDPLGTFVEDYEYVKGSGDLDEFNGRCSVTPEYPNGTYAYFLTTDDAGRLAFPYLIGPRYYGRFAPNSAQAWHRIACRRLDLSADRERITTGQPVRFHLEARDTAGEPIRHFESVHERPIHLIVASPDLKKFDHIHPELTPDDSYEVAYTFQSGGKYRLWADYSLPGEAPHVDAFDIEVNGPIQAITPARTRDLTVRLTPAKPLQAGADIPITLTLGGATETLEPYLGAWAHVIIIGEHFSSYAHAHPLEPSAPMSLAHTHASGPAPNEIHIVTNFPTAGRYKLWAQFQQAGEVVTVPFELQVAPAKPTSHKSSQIPPDAVRIRVTPHGYEPPVIAVPANKPLTLAFTREPGPNCGSEVVFPSAGIRKAVPLGGTVLVQLPAQAAGEIVFACGMGMFRGLMVARR